MSASAAQIREVRRMVAETTTATYMDVDIAAYIERYPLIDENGEEPREPSDSTGLMIANADWTSSFDLNAAARDIWAEKASTLADRNDFSADGGSYSLSQQYQQAMAQARYYGARRRVTSIRLWPSPRPTVRE
jgi:hypothetical protein